MLYGAVFFAAGTLLLVVTYLLVERSLDARTALRSDVDLSQLRQYDLTVPVDGRQTSLGELLSKVREDQSRFRRDTLDSLLTGGAVAVVGVGILASAFGWLVAGRALHPLQRITETARRIAAAPAADRGLHERIALGGPHDEVRRLADTFDTMLERLDRSFDGQRRFVANASHEMRTPLALNRALVEVTVSRPEACAEIRRMGQSLLAVNERQEQLIDGLLTLADSDAGATEHRPVDLCEIATHVLDLTAGEAAAAGVTIDATLPPASTTGDPVLLERLTQNLVENAIRHNVPTGGRLTVSTSRSAGQSRLEVTNTGPVIAAYEVDGLFEPFRRLSRRRGGKGFGLGLSIVRSVARAHGGDASARPRDGGGLIVTVTLPSGAPPAPPSTSPPIKE